VAAGQAHVGDLVGSQDVVVVPVREVVVEAEVDERAGAVGVFAAGAGVEVAADAGVAVGGLGEPAALVGGEEVAAGGGRRQSSHRAETDATSRCRAAPHDVNRQGSPHPGEATLKELSH
jgi:hypothetical protein